VNRRFWLGPLLLLGTAACPNNVQDDSNDVDRPSGLALLRRSDVRSDLFLADSEADGVRVIQLAVDLARDFDSRDFFDFLAASFLLQPLVVTAPGFPTEVAVRPDAPTDRVYVLSPGEGAIHVLYAPEVGFGSSPILLEGGYTRIATLIVARSTIDDPIAGELAGPVATVSLADRFTAPELDSATPVALAVVDEQVVTSTAGEALALRSRLLLTLEQDGPPGVPGSVVVMDVVSQTGDQLRRDPDPTAGGSATVRGSVVVEDLSLQATVSAPRETVRVRSGRYVVTSAFATDLDLSVQPPVQAGEVEEIAVPGLDAPLRIEAQGRLATTGPVATGASLDGLGLILLRANAPEALFFDCGEGPCVPSPRAFRSPFDDPDQPPLGPGRMALRSPPAVTAAFGRARMAVALEGGTSVVIDPLGLPGAGVVQLVHRDGVVSFLAGPVQELEPVTRRERTFLDFGLTDSDLSDVVAREALPPLAELFRRNALAAGTAFGAVGDDGMLVPCVNRTVEDDILPDLDPDVDTSVMDGLVCADDIDEGDDDDRNPRELSGECPAELGPRPFDGILRATYQGALFEETSPDVLIEGLVSPLVFQRREAVPTVDFVERRIEPGDRVHLFVACTLEDGSEFEVAYAALDDVDRAAAVRSVTPQRLELDLPAPLLIHDRGVIGGADGGPTAPSGFGPGDCERVSINRIEVFPARREVVLTQQTESGVIVEVLQRAPLDPMPPSGFTESVTFTGALEATWATPDGFSCDTALGLDFRDPDSQAIDDELQLVLTGTTTEVVSSGGATSDDATEQPCTASQQCGGGRGCPNVSQSCPSVCDAHCGTFGQCFIFEVTRSCPEIEIQVNGEDPVLENLNLRASGAPPTGAIPDTSLFVPDRRSFVTTFPGSRTVREILLLQDRLDRGFID
jgi:hypothetical protein